MRAAFRTLLCLRPSLGDFAFLIPVIFLFGRMNGARTLLGDGDTGWHIRTGEWILAHQQVPHQDIFSFTRPGQSWYAWEWLSDVLMGWLHQAGGMQAVLLGAILLLCLTYALLYRLILRKCENALIAFVLTGIAAAGSSIHWLARPHLFTMLLLIAFYSILEARRMKLLFILPVAVVIWTNLHGGFLVGILLVGLYATGELAGALLAPPGGDRHLAFGRSWRYGLTAAGCLAASLINPYGWNLHLHLIRFLTTPAYFETIAEFASINFRHPLAGFFEVMLFLGLGAAFRSISKKRFVESLSLVVFAHLALVSIRNIPLFMIIAAPAVGLALAVWLRSPRLDFLSRRIIAANTGRHWHAVGPAAVAFLGILMYRPVPAPLFQARYDSQAFPEAALAALGPADRVFTSDTWGGFLIYRRYPAKVFVDGRSDFYGPEFEATYAAVSGARYNWESVLAAHSVDTVLLSADAPLSSALKKSTDWQATYDDGLAIVFHRIETDSHK